MQTCLKCLKAATCKISLPVPPACASSRSQRQDGEQRSLLVCLFIISFHSRLLTVDTVNCEEAAKGKVGSNLAPQMLKFSLCSSFVLFNYCTSHKFFLLLHLSLNNLFIIFITSIFCFPLYHLFSLTLSSKLIYRLQSLFPLFLHPHFLFFFFISADIFSPVKQSAHRLYVLLL